MDTVLLDLNKFLKKNIFPSRTVLVFPPFNGFRRFLIHKLIEDHFTSADVAAFSIGQDINRRIVVCYKGLIRDSQVKALPLKQPTKSTWNMIDKDNPAKPKSTPTAAVYRPPAARQGEQGTRSGLNKDVTPDTKRSRVRRPDQQMYVPRPKRTSYGNDQPNSRSRSSSRTSLESDSCEKKNLVVSRRSEDLSLSASQERTRMIPIQPSESAFNRLPSGLSESSATDTNQKIITEVSQNFTNSEISKHCSEVKIECLNTPISPQNDLVRTNSSDLEESKNEMDQLVEDKNITTSVITDNTVKESEISNNYAKVEKMETISISSDSVGDESNASSEKSLNEDSTSISTDSQKTKTAKQRKSFQMEIELPENKNESQTSEINSPEKNKNNVNILPSSEVLDVLIISDSSSSSDNVPVKSVKETRVENCKKEKTKKSSVAKEKLTRKSKAIDPEECDWESLYDDNGDCLLPDLMEELTNSVGKVRVAAVDSNYRQFQSIEERTNDGECVIEIYDFPAQFKTTDLINIFAAYRDKNFQIKWVDDTHALGVFPSPLMADEVLACTLPFVKTRPLRQGIAESRNKARNLILPALPALERPKTCTALARRLVSGALGLRLPTSSQERERERQVLKEAREKRRIEAKQREAAWEGTLTSSSCM